MTPFLKFLCLNSSGELTRCKVILGIVRCYRIVSEAEPQRGRMASSEGTTFLRVVFVLGELNMRMKTARISVALLVLWGLLSSVGAPAANATTIYWTDTGTSKIQRADLNGSGIEDLVTIGVILPIDIALDTAGGKMYWTEASPADFMIGRADVDGTNVGHIITGLVSPSGIALDVSSGKIYWTDTGMSKIQRANLDGSGVEDLVTTAVILPIGIALDTAGGKMYWTEASPADFNISRAELDGSNVEPLITGLDSPSGIALDVSSGKMYWTDTGTSKIQRANLDGSELEDLVTTGVILPIRIALDIAGGQMYWTEGSPADFMIGRADLDGTNVGYIVTGLDSPSGIALDTGADLPTSVRDGLSAPGRFLLAQNWPNPFYPVTTIAYSIAKSSSVELRVYDTLGRLVRSLVNEPQEPNNYRVIWNGKNNAGNEVVSGVYFYTLTTGTFRATRKMVLLR